MNDRCRAPRIRVSLAIFALIVATASGGAAPASASVSANPQAPTPTDMSETSGDYDRPHAKLLLFVLLSAVGYAMHRQQRALESQHTLQNVS